jgi:AcrR family transcriptional regulator
MQAKSAGLRIKRPARPSRSAPRLAFFERRAQIIAKASEFFAEYGLTAQTRSLAAAAGISQRLLYRFFPTKSALIDEVYSQAILNPFRAVWLVELRDRRRSIEERLNAFYREYMGAVLTRRWMRLFLYASLAESRMAPDYIQEIIMTLLETVVTETAASQGVALPRDKALIHEIGWMLHGAVSHFAIRKHVYGASRSVSDATVIAIHVRGFIAGFAAAASAAKPA